MTLNLSKSLGRFSLQKLKLAYYDIYSRKVDWFSQFVLNPSRAFVNAVDMLLANFVEINPVVFSPAYKKAHTERK